MADTLEQIRITVDAARRSADAIAKQADRHKLNDEDVAVLNAHVNRILELLDELPPQPGLAKYADALRTLVASAYGHIETRNWKGASKALETMPTYVSGAKIIVAKAERGG